MKKALYAVLLTLFFVLIIKLDVSARNLTIVYVTNTGNCYHTRTCGYLRSVNEITLVDAVLQDYSPCSKCNPPDLSADDWAEISEILEYKNSSKTKETVSKAKAEYKENQNKAQKQIEDLKKENQKKDDQSIIWFVVGCVVSCIATNVYRNNK